MLTCINDFLFQIIDCTEILKTNEDLVTVDDFAAYAIVFKTPFNTLTVAHKNANDNLAKTYTKTRLVQIKYADNVDTTNEDLSKKLGDTIPKTLVTSLEIEPESVLFLVYGSKKEVVSLNLNVEAK